MLFYDIMRRACDIADALHRTEENIDSTEYEAAEDAALDLVREIAKLRVHSDEQFDLNVSQDDLYNEAMELIDDQRPFLIENPADDLAHLIRFKHPQES